MRSPETPDSLKVSHLLNLTFDYARKDLTQAFEFLKQADSLALATNQHQLRPNIDYHYAMLHRNKGEFDQSLFYVDQFMTVMQARNDTNEIIKGHNVRMTVYYELKDYEKTLETALLMKELCERKENIQGQIGALSFMALTMSDRGFTDEAISHYEQAIDLCLEINDSFRLANIYNNLAGAFLKKKDYKESIKYYELTKSLDEKAGYTWGVFNSLHNIGNVHLNMENYTEAEKYLREAYTIQTEIGSIQELTMTENKLGHVLCKQGKNKEGIRLLDKALKQSRENKYLEEEEFTVKYLSEAYADMGDFRKSLEHHKEFKAISDRIYKEQVSAKTEELQVQYETSEKEAQIVQLNAENEIKDLRIKQDRNMRWMLLSALMLSLCVVGLIARNGLIRKRANQALAEKNEVIAENLAEKEILLKEIHHRVKNNLQVISSLLNIQSRSIEDQTAKDAMIEGQNRVKSMALIHQNLYQEGDLVGVDTREYLDKLTSSLWHTYQIDESQITLKKDIDHLNLDVDMMIPLGLIINELISNALKHAFQKNSKGSIELVLKQDHTHLMLAVIDDGKGLPQDFNFDKINSMGIKIIRAFTHKLKGTFEILSQNGTQFQFKFPTNPELVTG